MQALLLTRPYLFMLLAIVAGGCMNSPRNGDSLHKKNDRIQFQGWVSSTSDRVTVRAFNFRTNAFGNVATNIAPSTTAERDAAGAPWYSWSRSLSLGTDNWQKVGAKLRARVAASSQGAGDLSSFDKSADACIQREMQAGSGGLVVIDRCRSSRTPEVELTVLCGKLGQGCCAGANVPVGELCERPLTCMSDGELAGTCQRLHLPLQGDTTCAYGDPNCNVCIDDVEATLVGFGSRNALSFVHREDGSGVPPTNRVFEGTGCAWTPSLTDPFGGECDHLQGVGRIPGLGNDDWFVTTLNGDFERAAASIMITQMAQLSGNGGEAFARSRNPAGRMEFFHPTGVNHPGGFQIIGKTLAVAETCHGGGACQPLEGVGFYSLQNANTGSLPQLQRLRTDNSRGEVGQGHSTGVALARLSNDRTLMFVFENNTGWFYVTGASSQTSIGSNWQFVWQWEPSQILNGGTHWTTVDPENVNFITDCDGTIYLVAFGNSGYSGSSDGTDRVALYRLREGGAGQPVLEFVRRFDVSTGACTLRAAGGIHATPSGKAVMYCAEHSNDLDGSPTMAIEEYLPTP